MVRSITHDLITGSPSARAEELAIRIRTLSEGGIPVVISERSGRLAKLIGEAYPKRYWNPGGREGIPLRASVSAIGPSLLAGILGLNALQEGVLRVCFRQEDEQGYLLFDLNDLQAVLSELSRNAAELEQRYGQLSAATIGAIRRRVLALQDEAFADFFGEPSLDIRDLCDHAGKYGYINHLHAPELPLVSALYTSIVFWLMAAVVESYEPWPERELRFCFILDGAGQLFRKIDDVRLNDFLQILHEAKRRGIAIMLATERAADLPPAILSLMDTVTKLGVATAELPTTQTGIYQDRNDSLYRKYQDAVNLYSAEELLQAEHRKRESEAEDSRQQQEAEKEKKRAKQEAAKRFPLAQKMASSVVTTMGREIGRQIMRGLMSVMKK